MPAETKDTDEKESTSVLEILAQARKDFTYCQEGERQMRDEYSRCLRFIALDQYPEAGAASKSDRASAGLPSLVVDQCNPCANQIINDWIRDRMGIQIGPADSIASEKTAKIFSGFVRNLEYLSHARRHYDQAFRNLVWGGRGYIGALTRRKKGTWKQELFIRGFPDSQAVYMDPYRQEIDLSDNNITFVRQVISKAAFREEYPGKQFDSDFADWGTDYVDWTTKEGGGVVAEYWKAKYLPRKFQKLTKPIQIQRKGRPVVTDEVHDDEYDELPKGVEVAKNPDDGGATWEEDDPKRVIIFRKITGKDVLSETTWLGKIIPIIPMVAKCVIVDGQKKIFSAISGGLDPQCQVNYAESNIAAEMGSETYVPWVGALGQFKSQRQAWQDLNIIRRPFIEYDPVAVGDKLVPPPQKPQHEPQIVAFSHASDRAQTNFRTATGINRSNLGIEDSRAKSGVAINALKVEGDNSTFDFPDAGSNAMELLGDVIVDVWPQIATEPEVIQILDDQEKQESVLINGDPRTMQLPGMDGNQVDIHMLSDGEYRVRVSASPTAATMREQTENKLQELFKELPDQQKAVIVAPLVREMSFNGKDDIADRLELPEYRKPKDGAPKIPPEAQAVITQGQQLIQAGQAHIALLEKERDSKILELQNKLEIEKYRDATNLAIARIAQETKLGTTAFEAEIEHIRMALDTINTHMQMQQDAASQESAQQHAADQATQAQGAAADQQATQIAAQPPPSNGTGQ